MAAPVVPGVVPPLPAQAGAYVPFANVANPGVQILVVRQLVPTAEKHITTFTNVENYKQWVNVSNSLDQTIVKIFCS